MRWSWSLSLVVLAFALAGPVDELSARDRSWHGPTGEVISRGDYFGVRGGQVILAEGSNKKFFALSAFSLDDRDALIDLMKRRKHEIKIAELMQFENLKGQPRPVPGAAPGMAPGAGGGEGIGNGSTEAPAGPGSESPAASGGADAILSIGETTTQVYGLPVPFPGLLTETPSRTWTSLLGQQVPAVFEELVAPAHVKLRVAGGRSNTFALVNFERADIDWLKETLAADAQKDVFPATATTEAQPLTPEQTEKKYRTWTDRKGRKLNAAFTRLDGKQVVLESAAGPQSFALIGISGGDRDWIRQEMLRRAAESRQRQEAAQRQAEQAAASSNSGGASGPGSGGPFGRGNPFERQFRCSRCGHEWTSTRIAEPCPNCIEQAKQREAEELAGYEDRRSSSSSLFSYKFQCDKCGHKWVSDHAFDTCPNCQGRGNGGGESGGPGEGGGHGEGDSYAGNDSSANASDDGLPPGYEDRRTDKSALFFYKFECEECGHKWLASKQLDHCPKGCTGHSGPVGIIITAVVVIAAIVSFVVKAARS